MSTWRRWGIRQVGKMMWMSRVNGPVEVDRGRMVWELIGRPSVEHTAEVW